MLKPEYTNRFSYLVDPDTKEAVLTFYNRGITVDEKFDQNGFEMDEVAKLVMTEYNLRELAKTLTATFEELDARKAE